jgi:hypothetical protein
MLTFMVLLIMGGLAFVFLAYQNYRRNKWQELEALYHLDLDEEEEGAYQDEYSSSCGRSIPKGTMLARSKLQGHTVASNPLLALAHSACT